MSAATGIVVVAYESHGVIEECLASIQQHEPESPLVVVDNASPHPVELQSDCPVIRSDKNRGYGGGCNVGAGHSALEACEFLAFLNPDVRLKGPVLTELEEQMRTRPIIGASTGTIIDELGRRRPSAWGGVGMLRVFWATAGLTGTRLRRLVGHLASGGAFTSGASMARTSLRTAGFLVGGALMVRRRAFDEIGGFDESYFMAWDDTDFCERLRRNGWELWVLPTEPLVHLGGKSSAGIGPGDWRRWYAKGLFLFAERHLTRAARSRIRWAHGVGTSLWNVRQVITTWKGRPRTSEGNQDRGFG